MSQYTTVVGSAVFHIWNTVVPEYVCARIHYTLYTYHCTLYSVYYTQRTAHVRSCNTPIYIGKGFPLPISMIHSCILIHRFSKYIHPPNIFFTLYKIALIDSFIHIGYLYNMISVSSEISV